MGIRNLIRPTVFSILIFFSISFLTVLFQINSPLNRMENSDLNIGFPFIYYNQFLISGPLPNSGWNLLNLALDFGIIWFLTVIGHKIFKKNAPQQRL